MRIITTIVALLLAAAHINAQKNMKENALTRGQTLLIPEQSSPTRCL